MKHIYVLILFVSLALAASAQNEYFQNDPRWTGSSQCNFNGSCISQETYVYYINGDTTFNSFQYKKVYRSGTGYESPSGPPPNSCNTQPYAFNELRAFVRSAGKQMYICPTLNSSEQLLYDFNLAVGDTLPQSYTCFSQGVTVTSMDSVLVRGEWRKRFYLGGPTWSTELVDGIGHTRGFLEPLTIPFECGYAYMCYSLNDTTWYTTDHGPNPVCNFTVDVPVVDAQQASLTAYPNPASDAVTISAGGGSFVSFTLRDALGRIVTIGAAAGQQAEVSLEGLANGVYVAEVLLQDGARGYVKLVKE